MTYPADWPRCPVCDEPALDGHITCGKVECDESGQRAARIIGKDIAKMPFTVIRRHEIDAKQAAAYLRGRIDGYRDCVAVLYQ